MLDRRKRGGHIPVKYLYSGSNPALVNGEKYTIREYSNVAGISDKTMHSRIRSKDCKIITDYDLRVARQNPPPSRKPNASRLESYADQVSQKWLARRLV
jgi:hypothetical protein